MKMKMKNQKRKSERIDGVTATAAATAMATM